MIQAGVDGFQAIEPHAGMDIAQIKRDYGDRLTLIGNVDCSTVLVDGPEKQYVNKQNMLFVPPHLVEGFYYQAVIPFIRVSNRNIIWQCWKQPERWGITPSKWSEEQWKKFRSAKLYRSQ